jgi:hypothetical protein
MVQYNYIYIHTQSLLEDGRSFPAHDLHHQAHLLRNEVIFRIREDIWRIVSIIVLHHRFLNEVSDAANAVSAQLGIVFQKPMERFKQVLTFVYCVVLSEFFIFFYYLTHKRFHRLETPLTTACNVVQTFV